MMIFKLDPSSCKHNQGFAFGGNSEGGDKKEGWYCLCGCSFYLNFNPIKFPDSIALTERKESKETPKLRLSKY